MNADMGLRAFCAAAACAALLSGPALAQTPSTHEHRFSDAEKWTKAFDDPERDA